MNDEKKIEEQAAQALISNTEEIAESGRTLSLLLLQRKRRTKTRSSVNIRLRI